MNALATITTKIGVVIDTTFFPQYNNIMLTLITLYAKFEENPSKHLRVISCSIDVDLYRL